MTTTADLIQKTKSYLFAGTRENKNRLSVEVDENDSALTFEFALSGIREGASLAIDLEIFHVWAVDEGSQTATVERGQLGSLAVQHTAGSIVTVNPKFPDFSIFQAINDDLADLSSPLNGLFRVDTAELTYNPSQEGYDLTGSTDVMGVAEVRYQTTGPWKDWPIAAPQMWEFRRNSETDDFASGNQLLLKGGGWWPGRQVRAIYKRPFSPLVALADDVEAVSGLPATCMDIPPLGAAMRLGSVREIQRNFNETQGETRRADEVPAGANNAAIRGLVLHRDMRVRAEALRLEQAYPRRKY